MNLAQEVTRLNQAHINLGAAITSLQTLIGGPGQNITGITGTTRMRGTTRTTRMTRTPALTGQNTATPAPHKRTLSAKGRKAIAAAQKARWAKAKANASNLELIAPDQEVAAPSPKKARKVA